MNQILKYSFKFAIIRFLVIIGYGEACTAFAVDNISEVKLETEESRKHDSGCCFYWKKGSRSLFSALWSSKAQFTILLSIEGT